MSKTLHNGLEILELLAKHPDGLTVAEIAHGIGVDRRVALRLVLTLEAHRTCRRDSHKRVSLGVGLATLGELVEKDLRALARPILENLANKLHATAHLAVRESEVSSRILMVVEPTQSDMHITIRVGRVDPLGQGSAGIAILSSLPPQLGERSEVTAARNAGYAMSRGEVTPGTVGISAPVPTRSDTSPAALGISVFDSHDEVHLSSAVIAAADQLGSLLG